MRKALFALAVVLGSVSAANAFNPMDPDGDGIYDYSDYDNYIYAGQPVNRPSAWAGVPVDPNFHPMDPDGDGIWDYSDYENYIYAGQPRYPQTASPGVPVQSKCAYVPGFDVWEQGVYELVAGRLVFTGTRCNYTRQDNGGGGN